MYHTFINIKYIVKYYYLFLIIKYIGTFLNNNNST